MTVPMRVKSERSGVELTIAAGSDAVPGGSCRGAGACRDIQNALARVNAGCIEQDGNERLRYAGEQLVVAARASDIQRLGHDWCPMCKRVSWSATVCRKSS